MIFVMYIYRWWARDLKKIINAILKGWLAKEIHKLNYIQSFSLNLKEKNVEKSEIKYLLMFTDDENKLWDFLLRNFPGMEKID